ncbi:MAG: alpha amylase C-terminal domain-containing protein [Verrucomicrobiota bacterium JB022]|nr:alpha amylase C-terminal domain-containing protein [Verrucomicrobiota bacterium JB022]
MGAQLVPEGGVTFRVWAPTAKAVYVRGDFSEWRGRNHTRLVRQGGGYWAGYVPQAREGDGYEYAIVGRGSIGPKRDPYSRELRLRRGKRKSVIRGSDYPWQDSDYRTPAWHELVIYQLHVGTFDAPAWPERQGTFLDVVRHLPRLQALGVNALLLLPIHGVPTQFSMGYNPVDYFAPELNYVVPDDQLGPYLDEVNRQLASFGRPPMEWHMLCGGMRQLKTLINLAHLHRLAVLFDVVYNHAGGDFGRESLHFFDRQYRGNHNRSLFFTDQGWAGGLVFAMWKREVRQFLIDNAQFFLREYHVDGFRFDEVSVLLQQTGHNGWQFCRDLNDTLRHRHPAAFRLAEHWPVSGSIVRPTEEGGAGFSGTVHQGLRDSLRHVLRQASYPGSHALDLDGVARELRAGGLRHHWQAIQCLENHDIVYFEPGNGDRGPRLPVLCDPNDPGGWYARSRCRAALGLLLTAPGIPQLFMGQEVLETRSWSDNLVLHGHHRVDWQGAAHDRHRRDYSTFLAHLLEFRRSRPALTAEGLRVVAVHNQDRVLAYYRYVPGEGKEVLVAINFNHRSHFEYRLGFPHSGQWHEVFNSDVYDHYVNPWRQGNSGGVQADGPGCHGLAHSARVVLPALSMVAFSRQA